ncbi:hypothetical protein HR15_02980 [Porphyromonas gulae]|uniref:Uncharacterized protein n=1 Tax=Porphyromonas gulae TaxID=111105 RepID=A0A0A2FMB5_9PORP|nr:hypothetical protein HR15_02980 [Porphyromonas gulae]
MSEGGGNGSNASFVRLLSFSGMSASLSRPAAAPDARHREKAPLHRVCKLGAGRFFAYICRV